MRFFICSAGRPGEDYDDENFQRCETNCGHFMHEATKQKGVFNEVSQGDIAFLKYKDKLVAYGEVKSKKTGEQYLDEWNYAIYVNKWVFHNENDHKLGVEKYGVQEATKEGSQLAVIKEIEEGFAFKKMKEINDSSDLSNKVSEYMAEKRIKEKGVFLEKVKNIVLTGAPGTGKTFLARKLAVEIVGEEKKQTTVGFVQFHQSYDYTDFVEGLRPTKPDKNGNVGFEMKNGVFKEFCEKALNDQNGKYVFIIDEINRGEPSKIFGELFYSIDPGYRVKKEDLEAGFTSIRTQYANAWAKPNAFDLALGHKDDGQYGHFFVPANVYIIGTMNDIDRSVESIDFAFRRRFTWIDVKAEDENSTKMLEKLGSDLENQARKRMKCLNNAIWNDEEKKGVDGLSSSYHIGAAYFLKLKELNGDFDKLWEYHIEPLLREYLRGVDDASSKLEKMKDAYNLKGVDGE